MEEIPAGEVMTAGMFLVNKHPTIVLFDSRASHSFMIQTFASKHDQKIIEVDKGGYSINSAGATISTNQLVRCAHLYTREHYGSYNNARTSNRCDFGHELDEGSWSSH